MPDAPQWTTAQYEQPQAIDRCRFCSTPLATEYYRVRGQAACASCAAAAREGSPAGVQCRLHPRAALRYRRRPRRPHRLCRLHHRHQSLCRLCCARRRLHRRPRHEVRLPRGSADVRIQIAAVVLTYLAIALAEIPIALWQFRTHIPSGRMLSAAIRLLPIGLASPIREMRSPVHGLINAVILFIGLQIAWRGTAATHVAVEGPFRLTPTAI